jgi:hypothetical protein
MYAISLVNFAGPLKCKTNSVASDFGAHFYHQFCVKQLEARQATECLKQGCAFLSTLAMHVLNHASFSFLFLNCTTPAQHFVHACLIANLRPLIFFFQMNRSSPNHDGCWFESNPCVRVDIIHKLLGSVVY